MTMDPVDSESLQAALSSSSSTFNTRVVIIRCSISVVSGDAFRADKCPCCFPGPSYWLRFRLDFIDPFWDDSLREIESIDLWMCLRVFVYLDDLLIFCTAHSSGATVIVREPVVCKSWKVRVSCPQCHIPRLCYLPGLSEHGPGEGVGC